MSGIQGGGHLAVALVSGLWECQLVREPFASPHMSQLVLDPPRS